MWCCLLSCTRSLYFEKLSLKSYRVTIHIKATEQHFPIVLFIKLHEVILPSKTEFKSYYVTIRIKATEQHFKYKNNKKNGAGNDGKNLLSFLLPSQRSRRSSCFHSLQSPLERERGLVQSTDNPFWTKRL